jgi:signal peptidase I
MQNRPPDIPPIDIDGDLIATLPEETLPPTRSWILRFLIEAIETVVLAVVLFLIINTVSARIRVDGHSMEPSFHSGNFVIVNKLAYRFGDFHRGDVIVFPSPNSNGEDLIKRVVGLPGDRIRISDGQVYVNELLLSEPYINGPPSGDLHEITVRGDALYVMGDNRNNSSDSRTWGPLDVENVLGKAVFVYWPLADFGLVEQFEFVFGES